uniref:AP-2 complex subunit mu (Trinotate prediction) n=1 Tax=Myxobolus squamalis TaxID=59785 RepID=A0A6B2G6D4_MYXSQ
MFIGLFILTYKGTLVYAKSYRNAMTKYILELFRVNIVERSGCAFYPPVNRIDKYNFVHMVLGEGMYIMGVIDDCANVIACLEFMKSLKNLIIASIGGVSEAIINKKRISIVELLEETCMFGIPQVTDMCVLSNWVKETFNKKNTKSASNLSITNQITGQITWRKPGIVHQEKTFYLTVNERVNVVVSSTGQPLSTSIDGVVMMKSYLSGMPECKCTLNGKIFDLTHVKPENKNNASTLNWVALDDCKLHQVFSLALSSVSD